MKHLRQPSKRYNRRVSEVKAQRKTSVRNEAIGGFGQVKFPENPRLDGRGLPSRFWDTTFLFESDNFFSRYGTSTVRGRPSYDNGEGSLTRV